MPVISIEELNELYVDKEMSARQIAKLYNTNHKYVLKLLRTYSIPIRSAHDVANYKSRRKSYEEATLSSDNTGYVRVKDKRQHRFIMEQHIGRELTKDEHVHHIDLDKTNNDIENLYLFETNEIHQFYHGYINNYEYISPEEYVSYYKSEINPKLNSYDWLFEQYVTLKKSANAISKELTISRTGITRRLVDTGIINLRPKTINQHD